MAYRKEHEGDCLTILGKSYKEVHAFLDQYVKKYPVHIFDDQHRKYLHNEKGLNEIREKWGDEAVKAGMLHIAVDLTTYIPTHFKVGKYVLKLEVKNGSIYTSLNCNG